MVTVYKPQKHFENFQTACLEVLMGRASLYASSQACGLSVAKFKSLAGDYFPEVDLMKKSTIVLCKNIDLVYQANNAAAQKLGASSQGVLIGLTDYDLEPEMADAYTALDLKAIQSGVSQEAEEKIYFENIGYISAKGISSPFFNEHHDCIGVLVRANFSLNLADQSFSEVLRYLQLGYACYFIKKKIYNVLIDSHTTIIMTGREMEILLYISAGFSYKRIASKMKISPRTAESFYVKLKEKFGCYSRNELEEFVVKHRVLSIL